MFRLLISWFMIFAVPLSAVAEDTGAAMFYVLKGQAYQNGNLVPESIAIFPGDFLQTQTDSSSRITINGSNILIAEETLLRYQPPMLALEHGAVSLRTLNQLVVKAGDVIITPITIGDDFYEVSDRDGVVHIIARKGDLKLENCGDRKELKEGYEYTCQERRAVGPLRASEPLRLSPRNVGIVGGITGGLVACLLVFCKGSPPKPASSWSPVTNP